MTVRGKTLLLSTYNLFEIKSNFRFGLVNAIKTRVPIKKGEEFFASYGYQIVNSPKWYRDLYRQFEGAKPEIIKKLDTMEAASMQLFEEVAIGDTETEI